MPDKSTPLQKEMISRIVRLVHDDRLQPGAHLNELKLAQRLNVSRTPVRAALEHLARQGFVGRRPNRGMELIASPPIPEQTDDDPTSAQKLIVQIAGDRRDRKLPQEFTESALVRLYDAKREVVREALEHLESMELVERKSGYGWTFPDDLRDAKNKAESARFRVILECGAMLEPDYQISTEWIAEMRARHEQILIQPWTETSGIAFYNMNAEFHEGICAGADNRFILNAIRSQNQIRRLAHYNWTHGYERVATSCREHLEILDRLEAKEYVIAAALMRRHIEMARKVKPNAEN